MVGEDDGVGQRRRVDLVVVAVEGGQLPGLLGRGAAAAAPPGRPAGGRRRRRPGRSPAAAPRAPAARRPAGIGRGRERAARSRSRSHSTGRYSPGAAGPDRVQHLAGQRAGVEPVGVAGAGVGAAVLEPQRGGTVEAGRRDDDGGAAQRGETLGDRPGERAQGRPDQVRRSRRAAPRRPGSGCRSARSPASRSARADGVSGSGRVRTGRPPHRRAERPWGHGAPASRRRRRPRRAAVTGRRYRAVAGAGGRRLAGLWGVVARVPGTQALEDLTGEIGDRTALGAGIAAQRLERRAGGDPVTLGQHADRALGGDAGGQGVLELGDGALQCGHPGVDGVGDLLRRAGGTACRTACGAVGLGQRTEFLGDEVGEGEAFDEVRRVLLAGRGEHRPAPGRAGEGDRQALRRTGAGRTEARCVRGHVVDLLARSRPQRSDGVVAAVAVR